MTAHQFLRCLLLAMVVSAAPVHAGRKIIIDQDTLGPGGSNLQSVLMLLQAPDVEVLGITVMTGDGWRDEEVEYLLRCLELTGHARVPVHAGAVVPLVNSAARLQAWERRYGALVYRGAWSAASPDHERHTDPAVIPPSPLGRPTIRAADGTAANFMVRSVRRYPGEVTIWSGGPLTNVALAARLDPQFASLARELVFMGGSFNPVPADNHFAAEYANSPRREFNLRFDPEAATLVLHEPWRRIVQVPIDPTTATYFRPELYDEIARGRRPSASYVARWGRQFPMWDELAAAVWLDPSIVTRRDSLLVDVDSADGASYGDTLSWPVGKGPGLGEREVEVVRSVDVPRLERMTVKLLGGTAP
ncbi:nucleoside hydrolase [soil metagenome]